MSEISWTKEEQKEHRNEWVKALRSDKYKQGFDRLNYNNEKYCCLGVACEVYQSKFSDLEISIFQSVVSYNGSTGLLPFKVAEYFGIDNGGYYNDKNNCLASDNDFYKLSFAEIANIIENNFN